MAKRREMLMAMAALPIGMATTPNMAAALPLSMGRMSAFQASSIADRLLQAYPARKSLAVIGDAYWQSGRGGTDDNASCLTDAIQALLERIDLQESHLHSLSSAAVRDRVQAKNAQDFQDGHIVPVQGWLLGETEARLCAIAAMREV